MWRPNCFQIGNAHERLNFGERDLSAVNSEVKLTHSLALTHLARDSLSNRCPFQVLVEWFCRRSCMQHQRTQQFSTSIIAWNLSTGLSKAISDTVNYPGDVASAIIRSFQFHMLVFRHLFIHYAKVTQTTAIFLRDLFLKSYSISEPLHVFYFFLVSNAASLGVPCEWNLFVFNFLRFCDSSILRQTESTFSVFGPH